MHDDECALPVDARFNGWSKVGLACGFKPKGAERAHLRKVSPRMPARERRKCYGARRLATLRDDLVVHPEIIHGDMASHRSHQSSLTSRCVIPTFWAAALRFDCRAWQFGCLPALPFPALVGLRFPLTGLRTHPPDTVSSPIHPFTNTYSS